MTNKEERKMSSSKLVFAPLSYTGWGSLENLLPEVRKAEAMRILIVTDPQLVEIGLTRNVRVSCGHMSEWHRGLLVRNVGITSDFD